MGSLPDQNCSGPIILCVEMHEAVVTMLFRFGSGRFVDRISVSARIWPAEAVLVGVILTGILVMTSTLTAVMMWCLDHHLRG